MGRESRPWPLPLKAAGFPHWEQARGAEWLPDAPTFLGLLLVGQQSLSEIFLLPKGKKKKKRKITQDKTPENPKAIWCRPLSISSTGPLENPLALQVGICVVASKALGVLAHIAAFWARLG